MNQVTINGNSYSSGKNMTISNGNVIIDGKMIHCSDDKKIEITLVDCTIDKLLCDRSIDISGKVNGNIKAGGSVHCDNVIGNIDAGGSIHCENVKGSVNAGGSIKCNKIKKGN